LKFWSAQQVVHDNSAVCACESTDNECHECAHLHIVNVM
jgi:hypothetical protein